MVVAIFSINISYRTTLERCSEDEDYTPSCSGVDIVEKETPGERKRRRERSKRKGGSKYKRPKSIIVVKKAVYGEAAPSILALECGAQCVRKEAGGYWRGAMKY